MVRLTVNRLHNEEKSIFMKLQTLKLSRKISLQLNCTQHLMLPCAPQEGYIEKKKKIDNLNFITSRVCGRGNVFVVSMCVCVCLGYNF